MSRLTGDFLRILSISAVMVIHASYDQEVEFQKHHDFFSASFAGILINQISRFCVPVFILLSGYGLTMRYGNVLKREIGFSFALDFYKKRFLKIGIPFVFWTVFLLAVFGRFSLEGSLTGIIASNIAILLKFLFVKGADYHFYFFTIILECYLLYPLLLKYRSPILFSLLLFVQIIYIYPVTVSSFTGIPLIRFPSSFFVHWIFYFYLGMISADKKVLEKIKKIPVIPFGILFAVFTGYVVQEYIRRSMTENDPGYYNHFNRLSVFLYAVSFWILFVKLDGILEAIFRQRKLAVWITYFSGLSFGVYIYHTMILRVINLTFLEGSLAVLPLVILISFGSVWGIDKLIRINFMRIIAGLPELPVPEKEENSPSKT